MSKPNSTLSQRIAALDDLIAWFDSDEFKLEEAMDKFKQAEQCADEIGVELAEFKNEIVVLKQKFDQ